jgi:hypothetical protein
MTWDASSSASATAAARRDMNKLLGLIAAGVTLINCWGMGCSISIGVCAAQHAGGGFGGDAGCRRAKLVSKTTPRVSAIQCAALFAAPEDDHLAFLVMLLNGTVIFATAKKLL